MTAIEPGVSSRRDTPRIGASPNMGVYIHIPFCRSKCGYCDFNSFSGISQLIPEYVDALTREIELRSEGARQRVSTIYLGGGTPSLLTPHQITGILDACRAHFAVDPDAETSIEANPGSITPEWLRAIRLAGVDRISMGFQSIDDEELRLLGRTHTARQAVDAYTMARDASFWNVNIDLIYGLPGQSLARWQKMLEEAISLSPDHFSLYPLTLEETTPLCHAVEAGAVPAPDPDVAADMYTWAEERLGAAGYAHYELSNWAWPGKACRHNLTYWRNLPYLGMGAGAHSSIGDYRLANMSLPADYISSLRAGRLPREPNEEISRAGRLSETAILGLRLQEGIDLNELQDRFGLDAAKVYRPEIEEVTRLGLVEQDGRRLRLTARGRLLGNEVFLRFLPKGGSARPEGDS